MTSYSPGPIAVLALCLTALTCGGRQGLPEAVFALDACGEAFGIGLTDEANIARAVQLLSQDGESIVSGRLARGDGGFNSPWSWHLRPETVSFAETSIEVCDGCPRFVESNLPYWVDNLGRFCPIVRVTKRIR